MADEVELYVPIEPSYRLVYRNCSKNELRQFLKSKTSSEAPAASSKKALIEELEAVDNHATFRFMDLITEIRLTVYEELLTFRRDNSYCYPQILRASRTIHEEAQKILDDQTKVSVMIWSTVHCAPWPANTPTATPSRARNIAPGDYYKSSATVFANQGEQRIFETTDLSILDIHKQWPPYIQRARYLAVHVHINTMHQPPGSDRGKYLHPSHQIPHTFLTTHPFAHSVNHTLLSLATSVPSAKHLSITLEDTTYLSQPLNLPALFSSSSAFPKTLWTLSLSANLAPLRGIIHPPNFKRFRPRAHDVRDLLPLLARSGATIKAHAEADCMRGVHDTVLQHARGKFDDLSDHVATSANYLSLRQRDRALEVKMKALEGATQKLDDRGVEQGVWRVGEMLFRDTRGEKDEVVAEEKEASRVPDGESAATEADADTAMTAAVAALGHWGKRGAE